MVPNDPSTDAIVTKKTNHGMLLCLNPIGYYTRNEHVGDDLDFFEQLLNLYLLSQ